MITASTNVQRTGTILRPDQSRVLLRPFRPETPERASRIIARIMSLPESQVGPLLEEVSAEFSRRHQEIHRSFLERFEQVRDLVLTDEEISEQRQLLIGSYFVCEFSLESAALFNPSIVPHPDQSELPPGALRFILSLRATGEGHISSITFRTGIIHSDNRIEVQPPTGFLTEPRQIPNPHYEKALFERKLFELGLTSGFTRRIMDKYGERFSLEELRAHLEVEMKQSRLSDQEAIRGILMLAQSNYEVQFQPQQPLSERILFPATPSQRNGIEDARFVRFQNDDGSFVYYATYTAYDGKIILPQILETPDFVHFKFNTLNGPAAQNKGMALFPRKINDRYVMISRQDDENILIMFSDHVHFWQSPEVLMLPAQPWEFLKIGNCGSPIETEAGWLVLSHGVGPMRKRSEEHTSELQSHSDLVCRLLLEKKKTRNK